MDTQGNTLTIQRPASVRQVKISREGVMAGLFISAVTYLMVIYPCLR